MVASLWGLQSTLRLKKQMPQENSPGKWLQIIHSRGDLHPTPPAIRWWCTILCMTPLTVRQKWQWQPCFKCEFRCRICKSRKVDVTVDFSLLLSVLLLHLITTLARWTLIKEHAATSSEMLWRRESYFIPHLGIFILKKLAPRSIQF